MSPFFFFLFSPSPSWCWAFTVCGCGDVCAIPVALSRCLVAIPTPSFVAFVILLEIGSNFLADPLRSPPCTLLVVIALGVRDVFWRSVGKAVPSVLVAILATCRIFLIFFVFVLSPTRAAACPVGCGSF